MLVGGIEDTIEGALECLDLEDRNPDGAKPLGALFAVNVNYCHVFFHALAGVSES